MSKTYRTRKTVKKYKLDIAYDKTYPDRYYCEAKLVTTLLDSETGNKEKPFLTITASADYSPENEKDCYYFCYSIDIDNKFKNLEELARNVINEGEPRTEIYSQVFLNKAKYGSPKLSTHAIHYIVANDQTHEAIDIPLTWENYYAPSPKNKFACYETIR